MLHSASVGFSGMCRVTEHLYLSNVRAARDSSQLSRCEITCIMNVTETKCSDPPLPQIEYIHIPISDSPLSPLSDHFDEVSDKIQQTAAHGGRTLVHCNAGVSRSAALCLAYLMKHRDMTLLEAHNWVKSRRPLVRPNVGFWKQLIRYEMNLRACNSVRMVPSSMGEIPDIYEEEVAVGQGHSAAVMVYAINPTREATKTKHLYFDKTPHTPPTLVLPTESRT